MARDGLHVHTEPGPEGYASVVVLGPDDEITLPYAPDRTLAVRDLLG